jgi:cold shock protein
MAEGTVKWFDEKKGFGFIADQNGPDVFVHFSQIEGNGYRKLQEGDVVEYEVVQGEKGPKAAKVVRKTPAGKSN